MDDTYNCDHASAFLLDEIASKWWTKLQDEFNMYDIHILLPNLQETGHCLPYYASLVT